jgi:hypothetical protein
MINKIYGSVLYLSSYFCFHEQLRESTASPPPLQSSPARTSSAPEMAGAGAGVAPVAAVGTGTDSALRGRHGGWR